MRARRGRRPKRQRLGLSPLARGPVRQQALRIVANEKRAGSPFPDERLIEKLFLDEGT